MDEDTLAVTKEEAGTAPASPEMEEVEAAEPVDPVTVSAWLTRIKPAPVLALLKDPDFALSVNRAFLGFRPDARAYANPLVRTRLIQAAVKDTKLAQKLHTLAEKESPVTAAKRSPAPLPTAPLTTKEPKPDERETLRAERDQRRRERDEARQALSQAEAERDEARKARIKAESESEEASRDAKRQAERIARLERQVAKLNETEKRLVKALGQDKISSPPASPARAAGPNPAHGATDVSPWLMAVRHLLDKGKFDQAVALAEDVLKTDAEEADALDVAVRALEGKRETRQAASYLHRLLALQIARQDLPAGAETLLRLLRMVRDPAGAEAEARNYFAALAPSNRNGVEATQRMLTRLRGILPDAHAWLTGYIAAHTSLGPILMPPPGALQADDPLPLELPLGQTVSARQLMDAVDQGKSVQVEFVRAALLLLESAAPETYARIWTALEQAAEDDITRITPLRRAGRGPILVDGSNVAWFDQESLVQGKPRLRHLLAMRRTLRARGFFPVVLYADANLPYFIDEPARLRAMRDRNELTLVDAGTAADEVLLRTAKLLDAPLVTNDKMEDWDPEDTVSKVRYTISLGGEAHLLADI